MASGIDDTRVSAAGPGSTSGVPSRPVSRGRYSLGVLLGHGGMATVVEADDAFLKRTVAIKRLRPELAGDADALRRFFDEADVMAAIDHPGALAVHDAGVLETGEPFYSMTRVRGRTLAALIAEDRTLARPLDMTLLDVFQRVSETIAYAHAQGIIHRDLKPENVMVDAFGATYVMDWGLAKRVSNDADLSQTVAGAVMGTPAYMAPETASGLAHAADARTDVFALGVILYQMLTGVSPFRGGTLAEVLERVRYHEPPTPRRLNRHVPRELSAICMKAIAKDPAARYPSANELAEDVRRARAFLPVSAAPPRLRDRARNWRRRHPRQSAALVTLALMAMLVGLVRGYARVRQQVVVQAVWTTYEKTAVAQKAIETELAETQARLRGIPVGPDRLASAYREAELSARLELARNDAGTTLGMLIGLSDLKPEPRLVAAMTERFRTTLREAELRGDWVFIKAFAASRLEVLQGLGERNPIPDEEMGYLRATVERADAEIAGRIRAGITPTIGGSNQ